MLRRIHGNKDHSDVAASLCSLAHAYKAQGRLDDSASLHEESLAMYQRIHGSKDHSDVAASLHSLAHVYMAQGRLDDSASLGEESLAMYRRIHGSKDHSSVAASLCSLAQVYRAQGRLDDSASLEEESLAMRRRIHGSKDHRDVATSLWGLAQVYMAQGRLDDSGSLHEESLAMVRRIHGSKDHSDVAAALSHLAQLLEAHGRLDDSVSLELESLAMRRRIHGSKHCIEVAASLSRLAHVYKALGRVEDAASLQQEWLTMLGRIHGSGDHSELAASLSSRAQVYMSQGRLDQSASLEEESLAILRWTHGNKDHSDVAASLCRLAQVYRAQGRLDEAASLQEEWLAMLRRIHGSKDHSELARSLSHLAHVYKAQGRLADACSLEDESLGMLLRIHGNNDHSDVAASLWSLAEVNKAQGHIDDSISLHEESLNMRLRIHGSKDHGDVAASLCSLAQVYAAEGRLNEAASMQHGALAMLRRIHGNQAHSTVAACLWSLAHVFMAQGRLSDSALLYEESLAMLRRIHGGKDNSDVVASMSLSALVNMTQDRLDDSASLHEESLAMLQRMSGSKNRSEVAALMWSLAHVYRSQGRLEEYAKLQAESLAMLRRLHGDGEHSDVRGSLWILAEAGDPTRPAGMLIAVDIDEYPIPRHMADTKWQLRPLCLPHAMSCVDGRTAKQASGNTCYPMSWQAPSADSRNDGGGGGTLGAASLDGSMCRGVGPRHEYYWEVEFVAITNTNLSVGVLDCGGTVDTAVARCAAASTSHVHANSSFKQSPMLELSTSRIYVGNAGSRPITVPDGGSLVGWRLGLLLNLNKSSEACGTLSAVFVRYEDVASGAALPTETLGLGVVASGLRSRLYRPIISMHHVGNCVRLVSCRLEDALRVFGRVAEDSSAVVGDVEADMDLDASVVSRRLTSILYPLSGHMEDTKWQLRPMCLSHAMSCVDGRTAKQVSGNVWNSLPWQVVATNGCSGDGDGDGDGGGTLGAASLDGSMCRGVGPRHEYYWEVEFVAVTNANLSVGVLDCGGTVNKAAARCVAASTTQVHHSSVFGRSPMLELSTSRIYVGNTQPRPITVPDGGSLVGWRLGLLLNLNTDSKERGTLSAVFVRYEDLASDSAVKPAETLKLGVVAKGLRSRLYRPIVSMHHVGNCVRVVSRRLDDARGVFGPSAGQRSADGRQSKSPSVVGEHQPCVDTTPAALQM